MEVLVKTHTRHSDPLDELYLRDHTAYDIVNVKPDGYYTENPYGGAKYMGVILVFDESIDSIPEDFISFNVNSNNNSHSELEHRSNKIIDLSELLTKEQLESCFDLEQLVEPIYISGSFFDIVKDVNERFEVPELDEGGSFTSGEVDVGPNGNADANSWYEFESNCANLTGNLTGNCDEAYNDGSAVDINGFTIGSYTYTWKCTGSGKHVGYVSGSSHCVIEDNGTYVVQVSIDSSSGLVVFEGMDIYNDGSANKTCVILNSSDSNIKFDSCIIRGDGTNGRYGIRDLVDGAMTIDIINCVINACDDDGITISTDGTDTFTKTYNINSTTIVNNQDEGIKTSGTNENFTCNMNLFNTIIMDNQGGDIVHAASGTWNWNIDYCIDSDNSIAGVVDSGTGNLANRTLEDSDQGSGNYVIVENNTTYADYDFRLQDLGNAKNNAQDMHSTSTAPNAGLSMPSIDVVETSRPQNSDYDCGFFEIESLFNSVILRRRIDI